MEVFGITKIYNFVCEAEKCTLCLACSNVCPQNAIVVDVDQNGFEIICVDAEKCMNCDLCKKVCQQRNAVCRNVPTVSYAAQVKDRMALNKSASGGAFQTLAQYVLENAGVCYGCEFYKEKGKFVAKHTRVEDLQQLPRILSTKYVPSFIGNTFQQTKLDLEAGRLVLFSGTPCQIQGLRAFLHKEYDNLLTADLVCHGIASSEIFNRYIKALEQIDDIEITDYFFRDKSVSWGTNFCYQYYKKTDPQKRKYSRHCPREESSYTMHYLRGDILRENCYNCVCANTERFADFTLGDYWGIEREHSEYFAKRNSPMVLKQGVSCILVNTDRGKMTIEALKEKMILHEVVLESITAHNENLRSASACGKGRQRVLTSLREDGYKSVEETYRKNVGKKMRLYRLKNLLKSYMPDRVRIFVYKSPVLRKIVFHQ